MRAVGQAASGLIYGIVALFLVVGSLSLALAQGGIQGAAQGGATSGVVPTFTPLPSSTSRATATPVATNADTPAATPVVGESAGAPSVAPSFTDTATATKPSSTAATAAAATATPMSTCGPPYGWVKDHVVRPGDTLYRIAAMYGVSVEALQRANCRSNTVIYVGERLWVPYARPAPTELTVIPTFPTPTEPATATESVEPSVTPATPDP